MERRLRDKLPGGKFLDVHPTHSKIMKGVRGKRNKTTELRFRAALISAGISGWKLNYKQIQGKPDFFFVKQKVAIFIDGCFWHGCDICGHIPKKNSEFWHAKINRNKERDNANNTILQQDGITVIRFWEHEIKKALPRCLQIVSETIGKLNSK